MDWIKGRWSERQDSNLRPLDPQSSALPGCATLRHRFRRTANGPSMGSALIGAASRPGNGAFAEVSAALEQGVEACLDAGQVLERETQSLPRLGIEPLRWAGRVLRRFGRRQRPRLAGPHADQPPHALLLVELLDALDGEPFIMQAGDCVLQPPQIRHRVLESSDGLEVIEVGCPALHETIADHDLQLPTSSLAPDRDFGGQRFMRHRAAESVWVAHDPSGFQRQDTAIGQATGGLAEVMVLKSGAAQRLEIAAHQGELLFAVLLEGTVRLEHQGHHDLVACDAFVIPAGQDWVLDNASPDLMLLQVSLPGPVVD